MLGEFLWTDKATANDIYNKVDDANAKILAALQAAKKNKKRDFVK